VGNKCISKTHTRHTGAVNPLEFRGNYSATSNAMKLLHWPLIGGLLNLVQQEGYWAGLPGPLLAVPNVTAHPTTTRVPLPYCSIMVRCSVVSVWPLKG